MSKENKRPMELWRYSGILLIVTGIIHTVVGFALGGEVVWPMVSDGPLMLADDAPRQFISGSLWWGRS
jgi:hypothetical protein